MKRRVLAIGLLAVLAACLPAANLPTVPSSGATPSSEPSAESTPGPPPTAPPVSRSPAASPQPPTEAPEPTDPLPPDARLTSPDGTEHVGTLGSYFYGGAAADSPWLPARVLPDIELAAGQPLGLAVPPLEFVRWSARYADAGDEQGDVISPLASGGDGVAPVLSATLPALPSGSWVLGVQVYFVAEAGDATYYWHVAVP